jgi:hypothetical protein
MISKEEFDEVYFKDYETGMVEDEDEERNGILNSFFRFLWEASEKGKHSVSSDELNKVFNIFNNEDQEIINEFISEAIWDSDEVEDRDLEKGYEVKLVMEEVGTCLENGVPMNIVTAFSLHNSPYCGWDECIYDGDLRFQLEDPNAKNLDAPTIDWIEGEIKSLQTINGKIGINEVLHVLQEARK